MAMFFVFFPLLYYMVMNTPSYLLYDFGILYNCYLRGVTPSTHIILELLYDYIAILCFYSRLVVQTLRVLFALIIYAKMHDHVVFTSYSYRCFVGYESVWEEISSTR
jgi:hypothetical protein